MTVRPATRDDVPAILEVYNDAVLTTTASYDDRPVSLESRLDWFDGHQRDGYPILVAVLEGAGVVGWASLSRFREKPGYRFTVENSVYVDARHRGRGVARALLEALLPLAAAGGYHSVIAGIDAANEVSVRLHAKLGFVEVGRLPQVGFKFGRWLDVIYMQRRLP